MKTSELTGAALDWAVAMCEGCTTGDPKVNLTFGAKRFSPSTNWSQAGPIIEREEMSIANVGRSLGDAMAPHPKCWCAHVDGVAAQYGHTPLIAAMRCYVASEIGGEVDIPEELL